MRPIFNPFGTCTYRVPFATALLLPFLPLAACAEDWPGFQGTNRDGVVRDGDLLTDWLEGGPSILWSRKLGQGYGGAAIVDGKVYLLDRGAEDRDVFRAYDLETGRPRWSKAYQASGNSNMFHGSRSTPSVADGYAFTVGLFGAITCFDLDQQTIAWQRHMDDFKAEPPQWAWSQSPLLVDDLVVIAPMTKRAGLVALKQKTGEMVWKSQDIGNEGYGSPRLVTLAGREQILYYSSTKVTGTDSKTGKVLWSYGRIPTVRAIPTPTVAGENRLFITAGYDSGSALIEVRKSGDGFDVKEINRTRKHGGQVHSALLVDGHFYVNLNTTENLQLRGKNADGLGCFDLDGKLLWKTGNKPGIERGAVLAVGGHLLTLGGADGVLRLIRADATGYRELHAAKLFKTTRSSKIWAPMAFSDGFLVVRSQNELKCIDLRPAEGS